LFLRDQREAVAQYDRLAGTGLTSKDPEEIVQAAEHGRIEALFVSQQTESPLRGAVEMATATALSKGDTVYMLPAGDVPGGGSAAAVLRH
jgi:hypothetical protein